MIGFQQVRRLLYIQSVIVRRLLTRSVFSFEWKGDFLHSLLYLNPWNYKKNNLTRGESIRIALEELGPVFVKFGQVLSTRRDLIPEDIVNELEKLQDQVSAFPGELAIQIIEQTHKKTVNELFASFDVIPLASASIAQVHAATLKDGSRVVVKVLRPNVAKIIRQDIAILYRIAKWVICLWAYGKHLHPVELVAEFERTILDELDLQREAANASQLRRNFEFSTIMYVPKIYWDFVKRNMLVMERIEGIRISDIKILHERHTNMRKLAERGVEIFFAQVFRDNFFHADMHPGNLFVDVANPEDPRYLGVDFGIMGSLSPSDQRYLAENLAAFFSRNYRRVAILHVESGWLPYDTRIEEFESAVRTVCEPIFEKPLQEISFGNLLLQLFTTLERFNMEVQPQLMLLQKTLLSVEGLGRQLYPQLDLWKTAKPFVERWISEQYSPKGLLKRVVYDWQNNSEKLLKTPALLFDTLQQINKAYKYSSSVSKQDIERQHRKLFRNNVYHFLFGAGISLIILAIIHPEPSVGWMTGSGVVLLLVGWLMPKR